MAGYSQPANAVYVSTVTPGGTVPELLGAPTGSYSITGSANIIPRTGPARLVASSTAGVATAFLHLTFGTAITTMPTVYVKINSQSSALLGGGLTIQAYNNVSGTGSPVSSSAAKTYYTADGNIYLAIKPTGTFQSVRLTLSSPAALGSNSVDIYYIFYGPTAVNDSNPFPFNVADCGLPNVTSTEVSSLLTLGSITVVNPAGAIDSDPTGTMSTFYKGGVSVTGHIYQTYYFNGTANMADAVRIILSKSGSLLAASLASKVQIQGYNGATPVGVAKFLDQILDVDLLGLLSNNNNKIAMYFAPRDASNNPVVFDRVVMDVDVGILGVTLGSNGLNVYDVRRVPDVPSAPDISACTNIATAGLSALSVQESINGIGTFTFKWYDAIREGSLLGTGKNYTAGGLPAVGQTKSFYVDIQKAGCTTPSGRKQVNVTMISPPVSPPIALTP